MSIIHISEKIKGFGRKALENLDRREVYGSLVIVLASIAAFYAGSVADLAASRPSIEFTSIRLPTGPAAGPMQEESTAGKDPSPVAAGEGERYVASKNGSKYHLPTCSGARSIAEANKVWFASKEEAEKAGYAPSASCPGI